MTLRIGTSGWVYRDWRGVFYPSSLPQSAWFSHYAKRFNTVEINYTFYHLPTETTVARWREQAPEGFIYALKGSRQITHHRRLAEVTDLLETFLNRARQLGDHLGPILWQLPPHWKVDLGRLETFAANLPTDLVHVFEFRDPSWLIPQVRNLLESHELAFCIFDMPGLPCPQWVTTNIIYLRFHGQGTRYTGRYGRETLIPWAARIRTWEAAGHTVYAYFNNSSQGHAALDAHELQTLCRP